MTPLDAILDHEPTAGDFAPRIAWTDYLVLPDPPGMRLEYEEGRVLMSPTGRNAHDALRQILAAWLERYEEENPERCVVFSEHSFFMPSGVREYRPDIAVILDNRKNRPVPHDEWIEGAPDIAVEILSDSTRERDLGLKARRYFEQGTKEYWLFDATERSAQFLRRGVRGWTQTARRDSYATLLLPGFELDLEKLWQRLDAKLRTQPPRSRR